MQRLICQMCLAVALYVVFRFCIQGGCVAVVSADLCPGVDPGLSGGRGQLCYHDPHHVVHVEFEAGWLELGSCMYVWSYDCVHRCCGHCGYHEDK